MTARRFFIGTVFTVIFMAVIKLLEVKILIPLLPLPSDFCYYHFHKAPMWVELFYLDGMGHLTTFNGFHLLILFSVSLVLGILTAIKLNKWLLKRRQNLREQNELTN